MAKILLFRDSDEYEAYDPGQSIFSEGEPGDFMYIVIDGEVDITIGGKVVETVESGEIMGEMALVDQNPRSATAVAKTPCKVVPISQKRFTFMVEQTPYFAIQVMQVMAERLRRMSKV